MQLPYPSYSKTVQYKQQKLQQPKLLTQRGIPLHLLLLLQKMRATTLRERPGA
jgi:hypothetical protein